MLRCCSEIRTADEIAVRESYLYDTPSAVSTGLSPIGIPMLAITTKSLAVLRWRRKVYSIQQIYTNVQIEFASLFVTMVPILYFPAPPLRKRESPFSVDTKFTIEILVGVCFPRWLCLSYDSALLVQFAAGRQR
jgi:hypothetical protein